MIMQFHYLKKKKKKKKGDFMSILSTTSSCIDIYIFIFNSFYIRLIHLIKLNEVLEVLKKRK